MKGFFRLYIPLHRNIVQQLNTLLMKHGLSYSLWEVLVYLHTNPQATLVAIAQHYMVEKPGVTRRVQRLRELALVKIEVGEDQREKRLSLTETGQQSYQQCHAIITQFEQKLTQSLSVAEQQCLQQVLPQLQTVLINFTRNEEQHEV